MRVRRRLLAIPAASLILALTSSAASAYFEEIDVGARAAGFGRAFTAIADDATAIHWNPSGLAGMNRSEILVTHSRPYGVTDVSSSFIGAAVPLPGLTAGVGWHHFSVADAVSEDLFSFAAAREVLATSGGVRISTGGAVKIARVSFRSYSDPETFERVDFGSATGAALDLSALVRLPNRMTVGYALQNLGQPEFDLVAGSAGGSKLAARSRLGLAYQWNPESTVSIEYQEVSDGKAVLNLGGEIWFYDSFAFRVGVNDVDAGGGISVKARRWLIDLGFLTNSPLGMSYRAGLRIPLGQ